MLVSTPIKRAECAYSGEKISSRTTKEESEALLKIEYLEVKAKMAESKYEETLGKVRELREIVGELRGVVAAKEAEIAGLVEVNRSLQGELGGDSQSRRASTKSKQQSQNQKNDLGGADAKYRILVEENCLLNGEKTELKRMIA
jgi:hypothetical protein